MNPIKKIMETKLNLEVAKETLKDKRGQTGSQVIGAIILLSIAAIFIATIFLEALNILGGSNAINPSVNQTPNITGATLVLVGLISIIFVLGVIILILKAVGIKVV